MTAWILQLPYDVSADSVLNHSGAASSSYLPAFIQLDDMIIDIIRFFHRVVSHVEAQDELGRNVGRVGFHGPVGLRTLQLR